MATTFNLFFDAALTQPVSSEDPIAGTFTGAGTTDIQLWLGSTTTGVQIQATSDPGTDSITLTPADASDVSGEPNTAIKLATSQAGLDSATSGAALSVGVTRQSGTANAFPVWVRLTNGLTAAGVYDDLTIVSNNVTETSV